MTLIPINLSCTCTSRNYIFKSGTFIVSSCYFKGMLVNDEDEKMPH